MTPIAEIHRQNAPASTDMPSWKTLIKQCIRNTNGLPVRLASAAMDTPMPASGMPMLLNPYFLSLIRTWDDPIARQVIPHPMELNDADIPIDPLNEQAQSPVPGLIHRYPGRVAFLVSNQCAMHCRFCMRKRHVFQNQRVNQATLAAGLDYLRKQSTINEVILTGGDPLMLEDNRLNTLLQSLSQIKHIRLLRIHTRMPSALPHRITAELAQLLAGFHPLFINVHINHPSEITKQCAAALACLAGTGIPLGSQTVLLKGINDDPKILSALMQKLLEARVRPYYLHLLDRVPGTAHFQVPLEQALTLVASLRGRMSGMAIPHLMLDLPGGGGKVALTPETVIRKEPGLWLIRNWQGKTFPYPLDGRQGSL